MLKRVMLYLMIVLTAARFGALAFVLSTDSRQLPAAVFCSCGVVVVYGLFLVCKWILKMVKQQELTAYYLLTAAAVLFNLFYIKTFCRLDLVLVDFLIIGTVMDLLLIAVLVGSVVKERKYVKIPVGSSR